MDKSVVCRKSARGFTRRPPRSQGNPPYVPARRGRAEPGSGSPSASARKVGKQSEHDAEVPSVARAITEVYRCAPDGRDECFCNYWGFSGHMCDSALIRHQLHMCPDCAVMEFPMCQCEILRPPFCSTNLTMSVVSSSLRRSLQPGSMRLAEASGGGTNDVAADSSCPANVVNESSAEGGGNTGAGTGSALAEAMVGELRIHDLPADLFASCSFYIFRVFVGDTAFIREYAAVVCAS